ncbi:MAG TPA: hypothetical protein VJ999_06890 [Candidatus Sulfotelmatobacter sp.]|nr:hypothetical protein [Candidatus Sulfotelmatobacter sp.]
MATARQHVFDTIDLTISPSGTVSAAQAYLQIPDNTGIQFKSSAPFGLNLVFSSSPPGTVPVPANGSNANPITESEVTLNYVIKRQDNGMQTGGPYAIQWGQGPLAISVTASSPSFTIAVPQQGYIQFTADSDYNITWEDGNGHPVTVWFQQPGEISPTPPGGPNPNPVQQAKPGVATVYCTFAVALNVPGKGTVKIGS